MQFFSGDIIVVDDEESGPVEKVIKIEPSEDFEAFVGLLNPYYRK